MFRSNVTLGRIACVVLLGMVHDSVIPAGWLGLFTAIALCNFLSLCPGHSSNNVNCA